ncbi:MAG: hypothetical protein FWD13_11775 [Treponema sp.]|nr:hypothetical protein [Treponema sp.]
MNERKLEQLNNLEKWLRKYWGEPNNQIFINETEDEKKMDNRELKKSNKKYAQNNFQGNEYYNPSVNRKILVSRDGLDKWDNITKSREQSLSIKKLDKLLENSQKEANFPDSKSRKSVDGFTYLDQPIKINENPYTAKIATKETNNGKNSKYYYHFLEDKKNEPN